MKLKKIIADLKRRLPKRTPNKSIVSMALAKLNKKKERLVV